MANGKRFSPEFAGAVHLWRVSDRPFREVAGELRIAPESLRRWVRQAEIDNGRRDGLTREEREELLRLRRENARLREEREILKKAATFFSRRPISGNDVELIETERAQHPVSLLCGVVGVRRGGFDAWKRRGRSQRSLEDDLLGAVIQKVHYEVARDLWSATDPRRAGRRTTASGFGAKAWRG